MKEHSESNAHCTSFNLWVNRQSVEANGKTCASLVSSQHAKIVKKNTDNLKTIIRVVYFLSLQGLQIIEDHENLVEIMSNWTRDSENQIIFTEKVDKYDLFQRPEV